MLEQKELGESSNEPICVLSMFCLMQMPTGCKHLLGWNKYAHSKVSSSFMLTKQLRSTGQFLFIFHFSRGDIRLIRLWVKEKHCILKKKQEIHATVPQIQSSWLELDNMKETLSWAISKSYL